MITRGTSPCTALTFVKNPGEQFRNCLQSGLFCKEHIVLDGGSTDGTVAMAEEYGATVIVQDQNHCNEEGRIVDFAGITNQGIDASTQEWVMIVSGDEELSQELRDAMAGISEDAEPGVYHFERLYTVDGHTIKYATSYPNRQIRMFHKDCIEGFIKPVHERPKLKTGVTPKVLPGIQYVPMDPACDLARKQNWYISLECRSLRGKGLLAWCRMAWGKVIRIVYRILKIALLRVRNPWKDCLPLRYEWLNIRYALLLIVRSLPAVLRKPQ